MNSIFIVNINLCRTLVSVALLTVCVLSIIDTLHSLTEGSFERQPAASQDIPVKLSEEEDQKPDNKSTLQTTVVFFIEFSSILISLLAGALSLLSYCCGLLWNDEVTIPKTYFHIPFPRKQGMDRRVLMTRYLEFTCFLLTIAGTFGSLMLITTTALRYQTQVMEFNRLKQGEINAETSGLCQIIQIGRILNACIIFVCNICILSLITNFPALFRTNKICSADIGQKLHSKRLQEEKQPDVVTSRIRVCLRLGRMILAFSSILISSGGLIILGRVLQLVVVQNPLVVEFPSSSLLCIHEILSVITGILCIGAGLFSVTAVQCCSVPLETFFDQYNDPYILMHKPKFSYSFYLFAINFTFLVIPSTISFYVSLRMPILSKMTLKTEPTDSSHNLLSMSYTLLCFATVAASLTTAVLITLLLIDLYFRIKLMDLNNFAGMMNRCWTRSSSMPLEIRSSQPRDTCDCSKLVVDGNTPNSHNLDNTHGQLQWNQLINSSCMQRTNSLSPHLNQTALSNTLDYRRLSLAVENTIRLRQNGPQPTAYQNGSTRNMIRSSIVPETTQQFGTITKSLQLDNRTEGCLSSPLGKINGGQLVYKCEQASFPDDQHNSDCPKPSHAILPSYHPNQHKFEPCEYMSCDLLHPIQASNPISETVCDAENENCNDKLIGYYFIDTTSEDFITSV